MKKEFFSIAYRNLKKRKMRSFLTVLGIFISIATIFTLLSLSLGLQDYAKEQFEKLGGDKIFIQPKSNLALFGLPAGNKILSLDDVEVLSKVAGVELTSYFSLEAAKFEFNGKTRYYYVFGVPTQNSRFRLVFEASNLNLDEGRYIKEGETGKAILGYSYKYRNLFGKPVKTRDKIKINGVEFKVVGILDTVGNNQDDQNIYISYEDFKKLFDIEDKVDFIYVKVIDKNKIKDVAERIERKLRRFRNLDEKTQDFVVSTPEEVLRVFGNVLRILTGFLIAIGLISVIVGGIGIANTMYTSVLERRKEIGTMKAIGAKNSDIMSIFIIESGLLGLIGGVIGVVLGAIISKSIEYFSNLYIGTDMIRVSMNPWIFVGCLGFGFFIGIVSGTFPSYQASRLKPADTLREE